MFVVITFYGCLCDGHAPQLPSEHRTNSQAHHETHEVDDSEKDWGYPMLPGVLENICLTTQDIIAGTHIKVQTQSRE
jgi:hypothetical protein